jgi:hypothetical protein
MDPPAGRLTAVPAASSCAGGGEEGVLERAGSALGRAQGEERGHLASGQSACTVYVQVWVQVQAVYVVGVCIYVERAFGRQVRLV